MISGSTATRITVDPAWLTNCLPASGDAFSVVLPDKNYRLDPETAKAFAPKRMNTGVEFYQVELGLWEIPQ